MKKSRKTKNVLNLIFVLFYAFNTVLTKLRDVKHRTQRRNVAMHICTYFIHTIVFMYVIVVGSARNSCLHRINEFFAYQNIKRIFVNIHKIDEWK